MTPGHANKFHGAEGGASQPRFSRDTQRNTGLFDVAPESLAYQVCASVWHWQIATRIRKPIRRSQIYISLTVLMMMNNVIRVVARLTTFPHFLTRPRRNAMTLNAADEVMVRGRLLRNFLDCPGHCTGNPRERLLLEISRKLSLDTRYQKTISGSPLRKYLGGVGE